MSRYGRKRGPDTHHVAPHSGGSWDVKPGGAERATGHYDTEHEAIDQGWQVSRNQEAGPRIHNQDGRIAQSDSHGRVPYPPKG
jgi:Uncharacterized protein conserved in bacteria (DUF2188)